MLLISCSSSENKANELIKEQLKSVVKDMDSYEVVETKLETAYEPFDKPSCWKAILRIAALEQQGKTAQVNKETDKLLSIIDNPTMEMGVKAIQTFKYKDASGKEVENHVIAIMDKDLSICYGYIIEETDEYKVVKQALDEIRQ